MQCKVTIGIVESDNSTATVLAGQLHVGMAHSVVPREGIGSAESLFFGAQIAANFLLASVVYGIFVAGQVVRS